MAGHVNSMRSIDVRRLWEKLHNGETRQNCFTYYREATFEKPPPSHKTTTNLRKNSSLIKRVIARSSEPKAAFAAAAILGLGVSIIGLMAWRSQSSSVDRVDAYLETLRKDWDQYQALVRK